MESVWRAGINAGNGFGGLDGLIGVWQTGVNVGNGFSELGGLTGAWRIGMNADDGFSGFGGLTGVWWINVNAGNRFGSLGGLINVWRIGMNAGNRFGYFVAHPDFSVGIDIDQPSIHTVHYEIDHIDIFHSDSIPCFSRIAFFYYSGGLATV